MIRDRAVIESVLKNNPFAGQFVSHKEMHVLFMRDEVRDGKHAQRHAKQTDDERFALHRREIYCHLSLGVGYSLLGKEFIEKRLKVPITARNWRTAQKLAEL